VIFLDVFFLFAFFEKICSSSTHTLPRGNMLNPTV